MAVVSLSEMMEAGAHFGHQTRRWNPKMSKYIYCARNGVHIIDLVKTALCMNNAYKWTRNAAKSGKRFLFVGTKKQASDVVAQEKERAKMALVFYKKHPNLRVRFMIQLTPLHNLLWQILCLGGLICIDRIFPLLRFLVNTRRNRLALEILRIPLNMIYIKELTKSR